LQAERSRDRNDWSQGGAENGGGANPNPNAIGGLTGRNSARYNLCLAGKEHRNHAAWRCGCILFCGLFLVAGLIGYGR
jgi:hypothetical protein